MPSQHRTKLKDRSRKYIFVGYDEKSKAYKLFDPVNNKVVVSRDVHVEETKAWSWSNLTKEGTSLEVLAPPTSEGVAPPTSIITGSSDEEAELQLPRTRRLQEIYNTTNEIHVVCLLADSEDMSFEKAVQDEKWRTVMDVEIEAIE